MLFNHRQKNQQPARNHGLIPTSDVIQAEKKMETEDPLYANIAPATPKRNSIRQSKKINKEGSDEGCLMEVQKGQQQQKQKSSRTGGESSAAKKLLQSAIQEDNDDNQNQNNENDTHGVCGLGSWNPQKNINPSLCITGCEGDQRFFAHRCTGNGRILGKTPAWQEKVHHLEFVETSISRGQ